MRHEGNRMRAVFLTEMTPYNLVITCFWALPKSTGGNVN